MPARRLITMPATTGHAHREHQHREPAELRRMPSDTISVVAGRVCTTPSPRW